MRLLCFVSLAALLIAVGFSSCKKEHAADYRDGFVGTYIGPRTSTSWMLGEPSHTTDTTDTVTVVAVGDSSIRVDATEMTIGEDGYSMLSGIGSPSNYFSVQFFSTDSLEVNTNTGGLGGGFRTHFLGRKQ
ncbi:MAG: hypothetical protein GC178_17405 [Flavobacteriales bacterium]|nr:hypothetical protein [Flavobacteriales bacterium]